MKTRIIQTRFYADDINEKLDVFGQHLYLYLLTCSYINICGVFQLRDGIIKMECKLTDNQLISAKGQLQQLKKVFFLDGWVYVVNARKNNNYEKSDDNKKACEKELSNVPANILQSLYSSVDSTVGVLPTVTINKKQEIINNNKELINKEQKEKLIDYLKDKGMDEDLVKQEIEKFISYWTEKNIAGTKERWQMEKTFEVNKRIANWFNNINKFGGKNEQRGYKI
jgi:hypothetical protein